MEIPDKEDSCAESRGGKRWLAGPESLLLKPGTVFGTAANSTIGVGIIGAGDRGQYVGGHMARVDGRESSALCDIFDDRIEQAKKRVPGAAEAKIYKDYRHLLDDKNVDAVLISTPVYLHPEMFEAAVAAKKHVYCEKPAGNDVAGVNRLMRAGQMADPGQDHPVRISTTLQPGVPESARTGGSRGTRRTQDDDELLDPGDGPEAERTRQPAAAQRRRRRTAHPALDPVDGDCRAAISWSAIVMVWTRSTGSPTRTR